MSRFLTGAGVGRGIVAPVSMSGPSGFNVFAITIPTRFADLPFRQFCHLCAPVGFTISRPCRFSALSVLTLLPFCALHVLPYSHFTHLIIWRARRFFFTFSPIVSISGAVCFSALLTSAGFTILPSLPFCAPPPTHPHQTPTPCHFCLSYQLPARRLRFSI